MGMFSTGPVGALAVAGVVCWLIGFFFEAVGDWQLARFKADPSRRGMVLDTGLWRYTRHPNYFGDAAVWAGLFLIAADSWPGLLTVLSPAADDLDAGRQDRKAARRKSHVRPPGLPRICGVHERLHPLAAAAPLTRGARRAWQTQS